MSPDSHDRVVVLGAGRSVTGSLPSAMAAVGAQERLIDWQLEAFSVLGSVELYFVIGYQAETIEALRPEVRFLFNPQWAETGPARSLALAPKPADDAATSSTFVAYSDVLWRRTIVEKISSIDAELVIAIDSKWRVRYDRRSQSDLDTAEKVSLDGKSVLEIGKHLPLTDAVAEFAGLFKVAGRAQLLLHEILHSESLDARASIPHVIQQLLLAGVAARFVDLQGDWAELDAPQDLARFVLGTKAESLARLRPLVRRGKIGDQVSCSYHQWTTGRAKVITAIRTAFPGKQVIVRSSALSEDSWIQSAAGAYTSLLDVPTTDTERLITAIEEVFGSYGSPVDDDQVLIQEMLTAVTMSGVVMTRTPSLGAPYLVLNFDDSSRRTDTVTSGEGSDLRTVFVNRGSPLRSRLPNRLQSLIEMVDELESLVGHDSLDIEFAFTEDGVGHILQVRPIAVAHHDQPVDDQEITVSLESAQDYVRQLQAHRPLLLGQTTFLSVMTDWNPAEMIGTKPNRLAFSLYRHLISDRVWARQRAEYGYRDVRPHNLIVDILGHPYVDGRVDFNSFVPAALADELAGRLIDYYLDRLATRPELHDKVEFEVLITCYGFDFEQRARELREGGFSKEDIAEIRSALRDLTSYGIARCAADLASLDEFSNRFELIQDAHLAPLERAFLCLEESRRFGVPTFAHLARNAFVAVSFLRSLEESGLITSAQREDFLASVHTVSSTMREDAQRVSRDELSWDEFVSSYGHLRPGSYDITSPCYESSPEDFLRPMLETLAGQSERIVEEPWDAATRQRIDRHLASLELGVDFDAFEKFLRQAIEGRELGKFTFMRHVNTALESFAEFGRQYGLDRQDMAHLSVHELMDLRSAPHTERSSTLAELSRLGKNAWYVTQAVCLPGQIFSPEDLVCFEQLIAEPNFVTRKKVRAEIISLSGSVSPEVDLDGRLVLIPNADPGFDWLFSRRIAGLVTMYGGVNSHMAIRAAELRLPAAIGVGDLLYEKISQARTLEIDCAARHIKIVG